MGTKTAVILLSTGTPADPEVSSVRKYLSEFLNDKRVIDLPWILRKFLVNVIIVPFRARRSARLYRRLWTENGSPLLVYGISLKKKLQERLGDGYIVEFAANYQMPNIREVVSELSNKRVGRIIALPLFPQYSDSATGSALEKVHKSLDRINGTPYVTEIKQYFAHPAYLEAMSAKIREYNLQEWDHILMSFHGLPERHVNKSHGGKPCSLYDCTLTISDQNLNCYRAQCYASARLLAENLNIDRTSYTVSFQSRLSKKWLKPFTDEEILKCASNGIKKLLIICPSFTADCLETLVEIQEDCRDLFIKNGGTDLIMVKSLNDSKEWVDAITDMIVRI